MRLVQIKLEPNQLLRTGEAFGVRRPGTAFPALEPENVKLDFNEPFAKCKARESGARSPHCERLRRY